MILVLKKSATEKEAQHIVHMAQIWGFKVNLSRGVERTVIGLIGDERELRDKPLDMLPGVEPCSRCSSPTSSRRWKLSRRHAHYLPPVKKGGKKLSSVARSCASWPAVRD